MYILQHTVLPVTLIMVNKYSTNEKILLRIVSFYMQELHDRCMLFTVTHGKKTMPLD